MCLNHKGQLHCCPKWGAGTAHSLKSSSPYWRRWQLGRASHPYHLITDECQDQLSRVLYLLRDGARSAQPQISQCSLVVIMSHGHWPATVEPQTQTWPQWQGYPLITGYFSPLLSLQFLFLSHLSWWQTDIWSCTGGLVCVAWKSTRLCVPFPMLCCLDLIWFLWALGIRQVLAIKLGWTKDCHLLCPWYRTILPTRCLCAHCWGCNVFLIWGLEINVKSNILYISDQIYILAKVKHSKIMSNNV